MNSSRNLMVCAVAAVALAGMGAQGQFVSRAAQDRPIDKAQAVQYLFPEQVSLPAGKPSPVALHFRVAQGLHINSHTPGGPYLIATVFSIPPGAGARLDGIGYPQGKDLRLPIDPTTKLNVYTGEFVLQTRLVAARGNHLVEGKLHYQACNLTQCMPPKTIDVPIDVIGR
jgi:hypothetical protein